MSAKSRRRMTRISVHQGYLDDIRACEQRLGDENKLLWEFFDAWTARENETTDFDLHAATVERFRKAHEALIPIASAE